MRVKPRHRASGRGPYGKKRGQALAGRLMALQMEWAGSGKDRKRIGAESSPLSSLVPGGKSPFLVTAPEPIPIRRLREPPTGAAFPHPVAAGSTLKKEVVRWRSEGSRPSAKVRETGRRR
jgi:hypothetical protein